VYGSKLTKISLKRQYILDNFLNQAVSLIIKYCLENRIRNIVIGQLKDIKQEINLSKVNNQNFVGIPYEKFKKKLETK
jgi:IS605 OrfB family transposase